MAKLAKLGARHNCGRAHKSKVQLPQCYVLTDQVRLPDPTPLLGRLPRGTCIILRHREPRARAELALRIIAPAHKFGLKVLIADDMPLALRLGADGVHMSEHLARSGRARIAFRKPGFIITAAAHSHLALWRAQRAGTHAALLSPVFPTQSHPHAQSLGLLRFGALARLSPIPVVALGGISHINAPRLRLGLAYGIAAIGAWQD